MSQSAAVWHFRTELSSNAVCGREGAGWVKLFFVGFDNSFWMRCSSCVVRMLLNLGISLRRGYAFRRLPASWSRSFISCGIIVAYLSAWLFESLFIRGISDPGFRMDQLLDMEALNKLTPEQQEKVIQGVRQQAAIMQAQNLITVSLFTISLAIYLI